MSYHHFTILFFILFVSFGLYVLVSVNSFLYVRDEYTQMEQKFEAAVDASTKAMCQSFDGFMEVNREAALQAFLNSLYASLDLLDEPIKRANLIEYLPVFAILEEDGFSVWFEDEYVGVDGFSYRTRNWSEKKPYIYRDTDYVYQFTLSGDVCIYDLSTSLFGTMGMKKATAMELNEGVGLLTLKRTVPNHFLFSSNEREAIKRIAIVSSIEEALQYYINVKNRIAKEYMNANGRSYEFVLPIMDEAMLGRSIEHPGILVLLQGYPISIRKEICFHRFSFAGAQIKKTEPFFLTDGGEWYLTYHKQGCDELLRKEVTKINRPFDTIEDCVKEGAYACEYCMPEGVHAPKLSY